MKIFYIADTHFGHEYVIKFDNRPFENVEEMNQKMLENWNKAVGKQDLVYILGDFMWKFQDSDFDFVKQLNGNKRLIKGNHDKTHSTRFKNLFQSIDYYEKVNDNGRNVIVSHYPMLSYDGSFMGRNYHLHGHVHTTKEAKMILDFIAKNKSEEMPFKIYNVGAMMPYMNYTPRTLDEILEG